ncbi:hypothetical protein [Nocardia sp. NPDC004711]
MTDNAFPTNSISTMIGLGYVCLIALVVGLLAVLFFTLLKQGWIRTIVAGSSSASVTFALGLQVLGLFH